MPKLSHSCLKGLRLPFVSVRLLLDFLEGIITKLGAWSEVVCSVAVLIPSDLAVQMLAAHENCARIVFVFVCNLIGLFFDGLFTCFYELH